MAAEARARVALPDSRAFPSGRTTQRLRRSYGLDLLPPDVAGLFTPVVGEAVRRITEAIRREIRAYSGPAGDYRRKVIATAVDAAVRRFVALVDDRPVARGDVDEIFTEIGRAEAAAERSLDGIHAAFDAATHGAREALRERTAHAKLPDSSAAVLGDALLAYMRALMEIVSAGYRAEARKRDTDQGHLRRRLLNLILRGVDRADVRAVAAKLGWTVPDEVVLCCVDVAQHEVRRRRLPAPVLAATRSGRLTALVPCDLADQVRDELVGWPRSSPVAITGAVPVAEAADAQQWAYRALRLAAAGIIAHGPVVDCAEIPLPLLLHADPSLLRRQRVRALGPLLSEPAAYRESLAQTLVLWLTTRDDAAGLADRLGVHPNTVLNRQRKLRDLFGERLTDPDSATALVLALQAGGHSRE